MARPPAKPALALVALLTAVLAIGLATSVSGAATASKRAKKCTHGRVLVKVNKKSTCRPLRSVLPKPRAGDRTLIALRGALAVDVSKLKGRHGKRARKLPRRAAAAAKKARKVMLRRSRLRSECSPTAAKRTRRPAAAGARGRRSRWGTRAIPPALASKSSWAPTARRGRRSPSP